MSERSLQADNARLRREIAELKKELADIRQNKPVVSESNIVQGRNSSGAEHTSETLRSV